MKSIFTLSSYVMTHNLSSVWPQMNSDPFAKKFAKAYLDSRWDSFATSTLKWIAYEDTGRIMDKYTSESEYYFRLESHNSFLCGFSWSQRPKRQEIRPAIGYSPNSRKTHTHTQNKTNNLQQKTKQNKTKNKQTNKNKNNKWRLLWCKK